jgi:tetratricopeptide (TPR) repeat protein
MRPESGPQTSRTEVEVTGQDPVQEYARQLRALREAAGEPTLARLVRQASAQRPPVKLAESTLSAWLSGKAVPASGPQVRFVLEFLRGLALGKGHDGLPPLAEYERLRMAAWSVNHANRGGRPAADSGSISPVWYRSVGEWDPFALGVHHPISAVNAPAAGLGQLPVYIPRDHDKQLRDLLSRANPGPKMVLLTGQSCVGKTRAAYEAVRACLRDWMLLRPESGADLVSLLNDSALPHPLLLWLDETRIYLTGQHGEQAAASLRRLLTTRSRVVVIGTIWNTDWQSLSQWQSSAQDNEQARQLLLHHTVKIPVPPAFTDEAIRAAKRVARQDPRLTEAVDAAAPSGEIAQLLAAGPWLIDFYENEASPHARALVDIAVDAFRLGFRAPLPVGLLAQTAGAYLDDKQRVASANWLDEALTQVVTKIRGAVAPLTAVRRGSGIGDPEGYILSDYLFQHAARIRARALPPAELWDALAVSAGTGDDHVSLGNAAEARFYFRHAVFHLRQVRDADDVTRERLARLLIRVGQADEAVDVLRPMIIPGRPAGRARDKRHDGVNLLQSSWWLFSEALKAAGRAEEAVELWQSGGKLGRILARLLTPMLRDPQASLAEARNMWCRWVLGGADADAIEALAWINRHAGLADEVLAKWQADAAVGNKAALLKIAILLEQEERDEEAVAAWRRLADRGDDYGTPMLIRLLLRLGRVADALAVWEPGVRAGNAAAIREQAALLKRLGRVDDAIAVCQAAAGQNDVNATWVLAGLLATAGRLDEAIATWRRLVASGVTDATRELAGALQRAGQFDEAVATWQRLVAAGTAHAEEGLAAALEDSGQVGEAIALWRKLAADGDIDAVEGLAAVLQRAGQLSDAVAVWQPSAEHGDTFAMREIARLLEHAGQRDDAEQQLRSAAQYGDEKALAQLLRLLATVGRADEARQIEKYGLEFGGATSAPWT